MSNGADQLTSTTVSNASAVDVRQRFTDLARRVLRAPVGMLFDQNANAGVRCVSSDVGPDEAARFANRLDAELNDPASGASIGTLIVADIESRRWSDDDRAILREIADSVSMLLGAGRRQARTDSTDATNPSRGRALPFVDGNHDLRTSLQGIVGLTELLKKEARPETIAAHSETIRSAADALMSLVSWSHAVHQGATNGAANGSSAGDDHTHEDNGLESAHILLADDLDLNRKLICDMLSLEGHIVDSVADGASAVKAAGEHAYDLILMDMIMPGMDGVAATRAIRALPSPACEVPIVALTAHSLPEQLDSCLQAGMDATLTKPMTMDALNGAVATWTRRRRKAA